MLSNSHLKLIHLLRQKKYRKQYKLFVIEGVKLINELIFSEYKIHSLFATGDERTRAIIDKCFPEAYKNLFKFISDSEIKSVSALTTPNKMLAVAEIPEKADIIKETDIYLALDGIRDPGNLGTIIRNSDWFGIRQVICSGDCADIYNPKVVQATMGSIFRVNIAYTSLKEFFSSTKGNIYASVLNGNNINDVNFRLPAIILIGNESEGIKSELINLSGEKITIKSFGKAESLNAAVASGIILNAIKNR